MKEEPTQSPFKFLDSYTEEDRHLFFGREQEVQEIYDKLFQSKLLLVYGASGSGKSSIINCGVASRFNNSDWLPIHIRRGGNIRQSMFNQIKKEATNQVELSEAEGKTNEGLAKAVNSVFLDHFKPIYLIFDQFEELFIFGYKEEWVDFISAIRFLMERDLEVHFIFVIRGEYLEFLSEFEDVIPNFFDNRVRVEKMTRKNAEESIRGPIQYFPITLESGFEENLIRKLAPDSSRVELTFLQVFLDKIYRTAKQEGNAEGVTLTKDHIDRLGQIGDVLAEFVDEQLFKMPDPKKALTVLKSFVSLQGTKVQRNVKEVYQYTKDVGQKIEKDEVEQIILEFVNKRILKDQDDNGKYEFRHDSLAQKIYEKITLQERELLDVKQFLAHSFDAFKKRGTLMSDDDLSYIAPHERNLNLDGIMKEFIKKSKQNSTKKRKQRRTRTTLAVVIMALMITSVVGFITSKRQENLAKEQQNIALKEREEALRQSQLAEEQAQEASRQRELAEEQRMAAESERQRAEIASSEAMQQREIALTQAALAEREKQLADEARSRALLSEQEARNQEEIATEEREKALQLRTLGLANEIAVKAQYILDPKLQGLLALHAFQFNNQVGGNTFNNEIYKSLYFADKNLKTKRFSLPESHNLSVSALVPSGSSIISASSDGTINHSTLKGNQTSELFTSDYAITAMSVQNELIVVGTLDGDILVMRDAGIISNTKVSSGEILEIAIDEDKIILIAADGTLASFNRAGDLLARTDLPWKVKTAEVQDGSFWVVNDKNLVFQLNINGEIRSQIALPTTGNITSLGANTAFLAVGYANGQIALYDRESEEVKQLLNGHTAAVTTLKFNETGELLLSGSFDRSARLWKLDDLQLAPITLPDHDSWISSVEFSNDGNYMVSGTYSGTINFYPVATEDWATDLCTYIDRELTQKEWNTYVGQDIPYKQACK